MMTQAALQLREIIKQTVTYLFNNKWLTSLIVLLSIFIPYFGWLGLSILALVTLRRGFKEGAYLLCTIAFPVIALWLTGASNTFALLNLLFVTTLLWLLATTLRETGSWSRTLEVGTVLTSLSLIGVHFFAHEALTEWTAMLTKHLDGTIASLNAEQSSSHLTFFAKITPSLLAVSTSLSTLVLLVIARAIQAITFNPGGLAKELREIRLSWFALLIFTIILLGIKTGSTIAFQLLPLMLFLFCIAGTSLVHRLLSRLQLAKFYLMGFYLLLLLMFPYMMVLLLLFAIADIYFNFRKRYIPNAV